MRRTTNYYPASNDRAGDAADSEWNEARLFAEALLGKTAALSRRPRTEAADKQALREWVAAITTARAVEWDEEKHPRGDFPENRGWFSPTGGAGASFDSTKSPRDATTRTSWSKPGEWPAKATDATKRPGDRVELAQVPTQQPGAGQQAGQRLPNPPVFPGDTFGQWTNRPPEYANKGQRITAPDSLDKHGQPVFSNTVAGEMVNQIPPAIQNALLRNDVKLVVTGTPLKVTGRDTGGSYRADYGIMNVAQYTNQDKTTLNPIPATTLRHEVGHAFDHMINASTDPRFLAAFRADIDASKGPRKTYVGNIPSLSQYVPAPNYPESQAAREAFAEAFSLATIKPGTNGGTVLGSFSQTYPQTARYVAALVNQWRQPAAPTTPARRP